MQFLCATNMMINPALARAACILDPQGAEWIMHPHQRLAVEMCYLASLMNPEESGHSDAERVEFLRKFHIKEFCGLPIRIDDRAPMSQIHLCDKEGKILVRITSLAIPSAVFYETT